MKKKEKTKKINPDTNVSELDLVASLSKDFETVIRRASKEKKLPLMIAIGVNLTALLSLVQDEFKKFE